MTMQDCETEWMAAMRRGEMQAAWEISDAVLAGRDPRQRDDPREDYHRRWVWDGGCYTGRHVLVRCYHGLGDTLQFIRYLAPLRTRAASVTLEVQAELLPLLEKVTGPDRILAFDVKAPAPPAECDIEIMELAHALRLPPDRCAMPILNVAPTLLPAGSIGLCWQAGGWDSERSMPPGLLETICTNHPTWSLQLGEPPSCARVLNPRGCSPSVVETASLIAGLSLVITVDTMIAHLAGCLNRPTWLLLKHDADWRWMNGMCRSPWYPSMRLYRQPVAGDWHSVVGRVRQDLAGSMEVRHAG